MKTILTTLNAKYIHTSLALRWLYVATKDQHNIDFVEFTIKETDEVIIHELLQYHPQIIGFSVYIWNVERIGQLIMKIKSIHPELIIILGGPEVSHEPAHFMNDWPIDYIVSGEGELVLGELLSHLENQTEITSPYITTKHRIASELAQAPLDQLIQFDSPYQLKIDEQTKRHRLIYFETSRGCPFQCQYCLSSLEKGVRYFDHLYIEEQLAYLFKHQSKTIKFLDRTFNINEVHTLFIFKLILKLNNHKTECHFEIYPDLLSERMIHFINTAVPPHFIRFEIGIQSTHEATNLAVKRRQNFEKIKQNIKKLQAGDNVHLHLDLIAGLPFEDYARFKQSFNDVFALKAEELQLGFLKMLRGTGLRKQAHQHQYLYDAKSPYEIYENRYLSNRDLEEIHLVEEMLERYWNSKRFNHFFAFYFKERIDYFDFFHHLGQFFIEHQLPFYGYQLDQLFLALYQYLDIGDSYLLKPLMIDYYQQFKIKPKRFLPPTMSQQEKKQLIKELINHPSFLKDHQLTANDLYKYAYFENISDQFIIIIYKNHQCTIIDCRNYTR